MKKIFWSLDCYNITGDFKTDRSFRLTDEDRQRDFRKYILNMRKLDMRRFSAEVNSFVKGQHAGGKENELFELSDDDDDEDKDEDEDEQEQEQEHE